MEKASQKTARSMALSSPLPSGNCEITEVQHAIELTVVAVLVVRDDESSVNLRNLQNGQVVVRVGTRLVEEASLVQHLKLQQLFHEFGRSLLTSRMKTLRVLCGDM